MHESVTTRSPYEFGRRRAPADTAAHSPAPVPATLTMYRNNAIIIAIAIVPINTIHIQISGSPVSYTLFDSEFWRPEPVRVCYIARPALHAGHWQDVWALWVVVSASGASKSTAALASVKVRCGQRTHTTCCANEDYETPETRRRRRCPKAYGDGLRCQANIRGRIDKAHSRKKKRMTGE